jgi:predicted MFS family arabinose efflux permease
MAVVPGVLRVRDFRRVWIASLLSNCGSWLQIVAAGWLVLQLTDSPTAVGALALVARGPAFLLSTYGGQLADRFNRRRIGMWTFGLQGIAGLGMTLASFLDVLTVPVIFALTFLMGIGFALGLPAMLALIPALAPKGMLSQAVSLNAAGINVARLAGPAIGGLLFDVAGPTWCFGINSFSFLALIAALIVVRPRDAGHRPERVGMRVALRFAWVDPGIRRLLVGMAVFTTFAAPVQELAPVVADVLDAGPRGLGLLLGAMGGGALVGAWLLERMTTRGLVRGTALPVATTLVAVGMLALTASPSLPLAMGAMGFAGAFWIWLFSATNTAIQLRSPSGMVGRMLGLYQLAVIGPIAVGSLTAGAVADVVGIRISLAVCACLLAAWGVWSLIHRVPEIDGGRATFP